MTAFARCTQWQPRVRANGLLSPKLQPATPQSSTIGVHPVIHVLNYMYEYSFTDP